LRGEIAARSEPADLDGAPAAYRAAITLATELGMAPLQAQCHLGLGQCYRRAGQRDDARVELATAADLFRSLDMSNWLPRAESERRACG
jgi:hypothetical protein